MKNLKIRRICLVGGPGSGKSKMCGYLNHALMDYDCDTVKEYVKDWAYEGKMPESMDQWYIYGKQSHMEDRLLRNSKKTGKPRVDVVITDSPLFLQCCYSQLNKVPGTKEQIAKTRIFERIYPSIHIFLRRPKTYRNNGRYQDESAAKKLDSYIKRNLKKWKVPFVEIDVADKAGIERIIRAALGPPSER